jgi:hypothetical protein
MKKIVLVMATVAAAFALSGCDGYFNSPERKAFQEFVKHCQKDPKSADCVAYENSKKEVQ